MSIAFSFSLQFLLFFLLWQNWNLFVRFHIEFCRLCASFHPKLMSVSLSLSHSKRYVDETFARCNCIEWKKNEHTAVWINRIFCSENETKIVANNFFISAKILLLFSELTLKRVGENKIEKCRSKYSSSIRVKLYCIFYTVHIVFTNPWYIFVNIDFLSSIEYNYVTNFFFCNTKFACQMFQNWQKNAFNGNFYFNYHCNIKLTISYS